MDKILVVYNICQIANLETFEFYQPAIDSILLQSDPDIDIVVSGCCINQQTKDQLYAEYADKGVKFCWIDDRYPVPVTFNKTCLEMDKQFGPYIGFLYVDSGIIFTSNNDIENMRDVMNSGPYAMVASRVSHDDGAYQWFGLGTWHNDFSQHDSFFQDNFVLPIGKAWNLHCQIFHRDLLEYYSNLYTDIFKSSCSESVFTFICAAIKRKWIICKDVLVHHRYLHGNASSIESPNTLTRCPNYNHPYLIPDVLSVMHQGRKFGLGYEQCSREHGVFHDPKDYDSEGFAIKEELKVYIKDNLFLSKDLLDYDKIECEIQ